MDSLEPIKRKIYEIRGQRVMLDRDLANMYGVETKALIQAVKRNILRFPEDFMFQLSKEEFLFWKSQIVTSKADMKGLRRPPYAFTEQGVAMLSGILNSNIAIQINISIMRAFVAVRQALPVLATQKDIEELRQRIKALEESGTATREEVKETKRELIQVYEALTQLGEKQQEPLPEIGYAAIQKRREEEDKS
ncbi:MAG: ORF6N domain-containing protein [Prevotella sp.]|nr:ORF6N domain-containing protein [Prevotella sp.]